VPAASHGQRQLVLARKIDRCNHIGHIHTASDQRGSLLDHAVVDPASLLMTNIAGTKQLAAHARYKLLDRRFL
jgi:dTDP-D-glucose 4,6-dehydratase